MIRNFRNAMMLLAVVPAVSCRGHAARTQPQDPIEAIPQGPLPVGSLAGSHALLLTVGGMVFGDSVLALEAQQTALLDAANAALDTALRRDAREVTWDGLPEQRHTVRRNPTFDIDPDRLPTSYLVGGRVQQVPDPLWSDIRTLAALANARYAIVPAAARIGGAPEAYRASYVLVIVDARTGAVLWRGRTDGGRAATPAQALARAAAAVVPNPLQVQPTTPPAPAAVRP